MMLYVTNKRNINDDTMVNFNQYIEGRERLYMIEGTLMNIVREEREDKLELKRI
jgi:hypothetical protein